MSNYEDFEREMARLEKEYDAREAAEIERLVGEHVVRYVPEEWPEGEYWQCKCGARLDSFPGYALHVIRAARE